MYSASSQSYDCNRKIQAIGTSTSTETYDYPKEALGQSYSGNRLKTITTGSTKTLSYNADGNLSNDGVYTYIYDAQGRLSSLQQNGVEKAHYDYNGFNQRVNKVVGGVATQYSYDENAQLLGEYDLNDKALQETVWLGNRPILALRTVGTALKDDIIAADHLNTPRELIDWTSKKVVWRWDGEPYGSTLASDDPDADGTKVTYNLRFPGQVFDAESGLHYNQNRSYNPATGRYLQADPTGLAGGLNLYTYAEANPTLYADPLGLMAGKCQGNESRKTAEPFYKTNQEATEAAEQLGFKKIKETTHGGQPVYQKGNRFISRDLDGHNGGAWKMAKSAKDLGSKKNKKWNF